MKNIIIAFIIAIQFISPFVNPLNSQKLYDLSSYQEEYSDKDVVNLSSVKKVKIDIKRGEIRIRKTVSEENLYLNKKAGLYAEEDIRSSYFSELTNYSAATLIPGKKRYKKIKVRDFETKELISSNYFYDDQSSTSFVFPSLREGAITRLSYSMNVSDPRFLGHAYFIHYFPVEYKEFIIDADKDIVLEFKYFNFDSVNVEFTEEEKGNRVVYRWKMKDMKPMKHEKGTPPLRYFIPHVIPYIKEYYDGKKKVPVLRNTEDLFNWYEGLLSKADMQPDEKLIAVTNEITGGIDNDLEKAKAIFKWIQKNIKYIALEFGLGGFIPREPSVVCETRYGDCKDMATLLVQMYDIAGLKAFHTWVGTRDIPYSYNELPTPSVDNHMIATFIHDGKYHFLDATDEFVPFGIPTYYIQEKEALIRKGKNDFEIKMIPALEPGENQISDSVKFEYQEGKITGTGTVNIQGNYYSAIKRSLDKITEKDDLHRYFKRFLEKGHNKFIIESADHKTVKENCLLLNYDFSIEDYAFTNKDEIYVNMNLSKEFSDIDLLEDDREVDFEFEHKLQVHYHNTFIIPDNYEISYIPGNSSFEDDEFSYSLTYREEKGRVIYDLKIITNTFLLKKDKFEKWNDMIKDIRAAYKEVLTLKSTK